MKYVTLISAFIFLSISVDAQYRKHQPSPWIELTDPPIYSCNICGKEWSVYTIAEDTSFNFSKYRMWSDSLKKHHIDEDSLILAQFNKIDTTCRSTQLANIRSEQIWKLWAKGHKYGRYWLDKHNAMTYGKDELGVDVYSAVYDDKGEFSQGFGGRFSDDVLLADKWYKIQPLKHKK